MIGRLTYRWYALIDGVSLWWWMRIGRFLPGAKLAICTACWHAYEPAHDWCPHCGAANKGAHDE